jgi:hypothetical protein
MSTKKFILITSLVALPAIILIGYAQFNTVRANDGAIARYSSQFRTHLSGDQEVPSVDTQAYGYFELKQVEGQALLHYMLTLDNIEQVTAAHLHCAARGQNGPVVVPLIEDNAERDYTHGSISGSITRDDISALSANCRPNIDTTDQLIQAIREGMIYVNVHTTQNPQGEIRGQITFGNGNEHGEIGGDDEGMATTTDEYMPGDEESMYEDGNTGTSTTRSTRSRTYSPDNMYGDPAYDFPNLGGTDSDIDSGSRTYTPDDPYGEPAPGFPNTGGSNQPRTYSPDDPYGEPAYGAPRSGGSSRPRTYTPDNMYGDPAYE